MMRNYSNSTWECFGPDRGILIPFFRSWWSHPCFSAYSVAVPTASLIPDLSLENRPEPILAALFSADPALKYNKQISSWNHRRVHEYSTWVLNLSLSPSKPFSYSSDAAAFFSLYYLVRIKRELTWSPNEELFDMPWSGEGEGENFGGLSARAGTGVIASLEI